MGKNERPSNSPQSSCGPGKPACAKRSPRTPTQDDSLPISHRFLLIANRHSNMKPLLSEFVHEIQAFTQCKCVGIRILDKDGNIPYQSYCGFPKEFYDLESPLTITLDQCMCINVIKGDTDASQPFYTKAGSFYLNGTTHFLATVPESEKSASRNVCNEFGYESVALVPIRSGPRILGLIHLADLSESRVPVEMIHILERGAMQLGTAIQRVIAEESLKKTLDDLERRVAARTLQLSKANKALQAEIGERRRLAQEILKISGRERQRISQDLHDVLGQHLTGLGFLCRALQQRITETCPQEAAAAARIIELADQATTQARSLAYGASPVASTAEGLMKALDKLAVNIESIFGTPCLFRCETPVLVHNEKTATELYHIAQEAVTNAIKHAQASALTIELSSSDHKLLLTIDDDGVGLPEDGEPSEGLGLHIMHLRASVIGAALEIKTKPDGGTSVMCSCPDNAH